MGPLIKQRARLLFVVLAACWALFCLTVQPILMAREGTKMYESDVRSCYAGYEESPQIEKCLSEAERAFHTGLHSGFGALYDEGHSWSYGWYYRTMGWALLI